VCYRNDTLFGGVVARLTWADHPATGYLKLMATIYEKGWATTQSLMRLIARREGSLGAAWWIRALMGR